MATLPQALAALGRRERDILALTRRWVEVNSYTENIEGVNRVGAMLAEAFALPSLAAETIPGHAHGDHHVWRTAAAGAPILLVGHHDTVFPPGHFEGWHEDGGSARGPGCFDMKGGLAIIWGVLASLDEVGELARLPLLVMSVSDEEVGSPESRPRGGPPRRWCSSPGASRIASSRRAAASARCARSPSDARRTPATPTRRASTRCGRSRASSIARSGSPTTRAA
jgi:hypothetical protein